MGVIDDLWFKTDGIIVTDSIHHLKTYSIIAIVLAIIFKYSKFTSCEQRYCEELNKECAPVNTVWSITIGLHRSLFDKFVYRVNVVMAVVIVNSSCFIIMSHMQIPKDLSIVATLINRI